MNLGFRWQLILKDIEPLDSDKTEQMPDLIGRYWLELSIFGFNGATSNHKVGKNS